MLTFTSTVVVICTITLTASGPALANCRGAQIVQVGAASGEIEKDTLGFLCGPAAIGRTGFIASTPRGEILQAGVSLGEAEKDTLGYLQTANAQ